MSAVTSSIRAGPTAWYDITGIEPNPEFLAYQAEVRKSILSAATPLNFTIVILILTLIYFRTRSSNEPTIATVRPITFQTFTPRTLLKQNGTPSYLNPDSNVYMAVQGKVYDVTPGRNFYGPGGPYENFAGRDATRGLACQSFDEEMLTKNLDGPLDPCEDLTEDERENLRGWVERFNEKYLVVGKLVAYQGEKNLFG